MEMVPCVSPEHLTPEQVRAYRIVDNKIVSNEWDSELLIKELAALTVEFQIAPHDLGFSGDEYDALMKEVGGARPKNDDYDAESDEEPEKTSRVEPGDVWKLGSHRLMCGDSTDPADIDRLMDGQLADLIVTDPPYNVDYGRKVDRMNKMLSKQSGDAHIVNDSMGKEAFELFLHDVFENVARITKPGGSLYCFHGAMSAVEFMRAISDSGFKIAQQLIWVKNAFVLSMQDYNWQHEPVIYGWKEGAGHYFADWFNESTVVDDAKPKDFRKMSKTQLQRAAEEMYFQLNRIPTTVVRHDKPTENEDHPTMKPVSVCGRFILNSSRQGETVLDPFGGSGSTLIACDQIGRNARVMELEPKHCDTILRRWEKATRKTAELNRQSLPC